MPNSYYQILKPHTPVLLAKSLCFYSRTKHFQLIIKIKANSLLTYENQCVLLSPVGDGFTYRLEII